MIIYLVRMRIGFEVIRGISDEVKSRPLITLRYNEVLRRDGLELRGMHYLNPSYRRTTPVLAVEGS